MHDHVATILEQWRSQRPDLDVSPVAVFGRISRIDRHKATALREVYRRHDCDAGDYDVLAALRRSARPNTLTPSALCRTILMSTATMTERLARLEQRGLVLRTRSQSDRRSVSVELTPAGRDLVDSAVQDLLAVETRLLDGLSEADRRSLARLLAKLAGYLDAQESTSRRGRGGAGRGEA
jgi:DNA-binding MarR family transcriptional regulator